MKINPLRLLGFCPFCTSDYDDNAVELLSENELVRVFHCGCQNCGQAILALMLHEAEWIRAISFSTDLQKAEAKKFQTSTVISSEECIDFVKRLSRESKRLCAFLSNSSSGKITRTA